MITPLLLCFLCLFVAIIISEEFGFPPVAAQNPSEGPPMSGHPRKFDEWNHLPFSDEKLTEVDFRVQRIGLGSSYAMVLRQLGRPLSSKREKMIDEFEVCGPSYTSLKLRYEGVGIELHGDLRGRNFEVVSMEVSSPRLLIAPGIRIGMREQEVRSRLGGLPWQERDESGFHKLYYVTKGNDGGAILHFAAGRLVKVDWKYTLC